MESRNWTCTEVLKCVSLHFCVSGVGLSRVPIVSNNKKYIKILKSSIIHRTWMIDWGKGLTFETSSFYLRLPSFLVHARYHDTWKNNTRWFSEDGSVYSLYSGFVIKSLISSLGGRRCVLESPPVKGYCNFSSAKSTAREDRKIKRPRKRQRERERMKGKEGNGTINLTFYKSHVMTSDVDRRKLVRFIF